MFVIIRKDGKYVTRPGQEKSYTDDLRKAWMFRSREAADKQRCPGNESIVSLEALLDIDD